MYTKPEVVTIVGIGIVTVVNSTLVLIYNMSSGSSLMLMLLFG